MNIRIAKGDDLHCHLRRGAVLESVVSFTTQQFGRAIIMPNTSPPILTAEDATAYRQEIETHEFDAFTPLMTIQITDFTTPAMITEAKKAGVVAGKIYPQGVTHNSQNGVTNFKALYPVFAQMQHQQMLLLIHGESPDPHVFCLDREKQFLIGPLFLIALNFPDLKIVLEHITTREAVSAIMHEKNKNVAATITAHHLALTLDDVVGNLISPHNFCKPLAKRPEDREALLQAATSGNLKFFFGSDSAPHLKENKECSHGCAGVFSAPVALALLAQIFEERGTLDKLENFVSKFGADFYGLPYNKDTVDLAKKDWKVPGGYGVSGGDMVVPFMAGETLRWQVAD